MHANGEAKRKPSCRESAVNDHDHLRQQITAVINIGAHWGYVEHSIDNLGGQLRDYQGRHQGGNS